MSEHKLQPVRGTKDLFAEEIIAFNQIIDLAKEKARAFGFGELQLPIFEFSEIFERNLGETSDIVSKEVYKFLDRGENYLTLRPEFTAGVVRAFISNGELQQILPQKFFSFGPIFRYDRPQKGRQRQFNQINFEIIGEENFYCDVEMIILAAEILRNLGILQNLKLDINSLGCPKTKDSYQQALTEYFTKYKNELSQDSQKRLEKNPLRILDSKDANDIKLCFGAPIMSKYFSVEAKNRFENILNLLTKFGISFNVNERLVRGLDYYTSTVFEFVNNHEGAQNTVLAGGRYDNLIGKMGGKETPAIGFAAGVERLMLMAQITKKNTNKVLVTYISENEKFAAFEIAQKLRQNNIECEFIFDGNFKKQMKKANQINARFVVIIGENEVKNNEVVVKNFGNSSEEKVVLSSLVSYLTSLQ